MFDTLSSLYEALTPVLGLGRRRRAGGAARRGAPGLRQPAQGGRHARATRWSRGWIPTTSTPRWSPARSAPASRTSTRSPQLLARRAGLQRRHRAACGGWPGLAVPADEEIRDAFDGRCASPSARTRTPRRPTRSARPTSPRCCAARWQSATRERLTDDCPVCGTPGRARRRAGRRTRPSRPRRSTSRRAALTQRRASGSRAARRRVDALLDANARAAPAAAAPAPALDERRRPRRDRAARLRRDAALAAAAQLRALSRRADAELSRRGAAWQELSTHVGAWLEQAREVEARAAHAEGAQGRREVGQGRGRGPARGALRADLRARDRELARAAAGLERRPARHHAQEGRPQRAGRLRRARRRRGRERARRDVAGRAARAVGQRLPAARRRSTSRRSASP